MPQDQRPGGLDRPTAAGAGWAAGRRRVYPFVELGEAVRHRPARLGQVRLVAVDGGTGSGKTVFAARLATALTGTGTTVEVVHTDDLLDGWGDQFTFWPRLEDTVLRLMRQGEPARQPVYDWNTGAYRPDRRLLPVPEVLIVEGVSAARSDLAAELSLAVLVLTGADKALRRGLDRADSAGLDPVLRRWQEAEREWYRRDGTAGRVDLVVDGDPPVRHDPEQEFVTIGEVDAWTTPSKAGNGSR